MGILGFVLSFFWSCTYAGTTSRVPTTVTPTVAASASDIHFEDNLDFANMRQAIHRQLEAYEQPGILDGNIRFGKKTYPKTILRDSLIAFLHITEKTSSCIASRARTRTECVRGLNSAIASRFAIYTPSAGKSKFTAYYSPDVLASHTPSERFNLPLYSTPQTEEARTSTREDIIYHHKLDGQGYEIGYADLSLFDLYSLQIEGGGRIHFFDNKGDETIRYISFQGANDQKLVFFSKLFLKYGYLDAAHLGYNDQRDYFAAHPEIQQKFFAESPSYVYFKITDEEPAGIDTVALTENRSLAFDKGIYGVSGILNFVQSQVGKEPLNQFFIGQDVGSAIKGGARADLYFGYGEKARIAAESLVGSGHQYFLIKK